MSRAATRIILTAFLVWLFLSPSGGVAPIAAAEALQPGQVGLDLTALPPGEGSGVLIVSVIPGSPAAAEDLRDGDIIAKVVQEEVNSPADVISRIQKAYKEGKKSVRLLVYRGDDPRVVAIKFSTGGVTAEASPASPTPAPVAPAGPRAATPPFKGAKAPTPPAAEAESVYPIPSIGLGLALGGWPDGVPVRKVEPGGPAARAGIVVGDAIKFADDLRVSDAAVLYRRTNDPSKTGLTIILGRQGQNYSAQIQLPRTAASTSPSVAAAPKPTTSTAPVSSGKTVIEPRLGMEFGSLPGNKDGARIIRSWNALPRADGNKLDIKPGTTVSKIVSFLANPQNPDNLVENTAIVRGPQYIPIILDSILRSQRTRHDVVALVLNDSDDEVLAVGLLPADSPAPASPPVVATAPVPAPISPPVVASAPSVAPKAVSPGPSSPTVKEERHLSLTEILQGMLFNAPLEFAAYAIFNPWCLIVGIVIGFAFHRNWMLRTVLALVVSCYLGGFLLFLLFMNDMDFMYKFMLWGDARHPESNWDFRIFPALIYPVVGTIGNILIPPRYLSDSFTGYWFYGLLLIVIYVGALRWVGPAVRHAEWQRLWSLLARIPIPAPRVPVAAYASPSPPPLDDEEEEIALARRAVEEAESGQWQPPESAAVTGGPSWWQQRQERKEVERAQREMARAEQEARSPRHEHPSYPYPPPYAYHQPPKTPLSEWFRMAYFAGRFAILLIVTISLWWAGSSVYATIGALIPAPLRGLFADTLEAVSTKVRQSDHIGQ